MSEYKILLEKPAVRFIEKLPRTEKERLLHAIYRLPHDGDIKRLRGQKALELYRLRVGSYRIIYTVDDGKLVVCVIDAGNRGQIYNRY